MGLENSKTQKMSNDDIVGNINKLFGSLNIPSEISESLHMDNYSGGDMYPTRQRYKEFEYQLGGMMKQMQLNKNLHNLSNAMSGGAGEDYDSDLEDFNDADEIVEEDGMVDNIADGFVEENGMIDDDADGMIGGGLSETSRANMTEIRNMKTDVLSPTSADVSNKKVNPLSQQDGGCDILSSLSGFLSGKSTTSQVFNEGMNKGVNKMQGGGAETSLSSLVGMTSVMNGGKKQSSEEINVMPFYSSTSGSEYYNEMQRENRYT
jgi:hypothetical protein